MKTVEGEGRALQLHPEEMLSGVRSRVFNGMENDIDMTDVSNENGVEDDTNLIHRVPMPLDSGLASDLSKAVDRHTNSDVLFFVATMTKERTKKKKCIDMYSSFVLNILFSIFAKKKISCLHKKDGLPTVLLKCSYIFG